MEIVEALTEAACIRADHPLSSIVFTAALLASNKVTHSVCPCIAASIKAVRPSLFMRSRLALQSDRRCQASA